MSRTILTLGTFDIPHVGHWRFLGRAMDWAMLTESELIVGVNSDAFVERFKGKRPIFSQHERMAAIRDWGYEAVLNGGKGKSLIARYKPRALVIGTDWMYPRDYLSQIGLTARWMENNDCAVIFVPYTTGISTTAIKDRVHAAI